MSGQVHSPSTLPVCAAPNNMEKIKTTLPSFEFVHTARGLLTGSAHPDALWRFVLGTSCVIGLVIGVFAYLAYTWAGSTVSPVVVTQSAKAMLSADELHSVIEIYRKKSSTYRTLLQTRPTSPSLGIDAGVIVPKEGTTNPDEATTSEVPPLGSPESVQ